MSRGLLLDSHAFLWAASEPERLTPEIRGLLESETSKLYLSSATVWELLIKVRKKKIDLGGDPATKLQEYGKRLRVIPVHVSAQHLYQAFELEGLHKDPFDRLLIAQAKIERLTFVTRDQTIQKYNIETLW
ncbi:MAG: type II toxin-antitoxin system VapC family toxin [Acidobacteriota bacterium]|nr:type II toxin-antitoxin system VapC family toxin [Acidobacteriota bacterium]